MGDWSSKRGEGRGIQWMRAHQNYAGGECLIWPMSKDWQGYGMFSYLGKSHRANRFMCELAHGPAPEDKPFALHTCGNGHRACANPRHLYWGTPSDNQRDSVAHGTAKKPGRRRQKLTDADVAEIRELAKTIKQYQIAGRYGVRRETIGQILRGTWRKGKRPELNRLLDPASRSTMRMDAKMMRANSVSFDEIASRMRVSRATVYRLTRE